jgi:hypothetical protein
MKDQYGRKVPDDLVVLEGGEFTPDDEFEILDQARWYEVEGRQDVILVSSAEINGLSETNPLDVGIDLSKSKVMRIDDVLKRYDETDGFYHA